jgi:hypothetical protein
VGRKVDGEIHEFVRREVGLPRQQLSEGDAGAEQGAENLNVLIQRVAAASTEEIDRVILELQGVRDMLRNKGERVHQDLVSYASLNQHLMTGMRIIAENLKQWNGTPVSREQAIADFKARLLGAP